MVPEGLGGEGWTGFGAGGLGTTFGDSFGGKYSRSLAGWSFCPGLPGLGGCLPGGPNDIKKLM